MKINEKNLCHFATVPPYDLDGYLNKRGEGNKSWQKRYFVLKGNLLFYFEKQGDKEPLGLIILEGCIIELAEEIEPYTFQIVFEGNRTYLLNTNTQQNMERWMRSLACAGYEYKKLLLAELQRQLEEIEETHKKQAEEALPPVAPKPPPRRQNPFNRPAPPPPSLPSTSTVNENNGNSIDDHSGNPQKSPNNHEPAIGTEILSSGAGENTASTQSSSVLGSGSGGGVHNNTRQDTVFYTGGAINVPAFNNNTNHSNNASFDAAAGGGSGKSKFYGSLIQQQQQPSKSSSSSSLHNSKSNHSELFLQIHEQFRKIILNDINEHWKRKEDAQKPLIEL